jgi:hypothetical protein
LDMTLTLANMFLAVLLLLVVNEHYRRRLRDGFGKAGGALP